MAPRNRGPLAIKSLEKTNRPIENRTGNGAFGKNFPDWGGSDPDWEAVKAGSAILGLHGGVAECAFLSSQYRAMWASMAKVKIKLVSVLQTLRDKKIPFVLTGAHGIAGWTGRPRATHDVDILVKPGRNYVRAVNAVKALYPQLEARRFGGVTAFFVPGETLSLIDVTCPFRADNEATLQSAVWIEDRKLKYRVPTLEAALANKYGAMLSTGRDPGKRAQDAIDFYQMVKHSLTKGRQPIDLEKLADLGEMAWSGGGGKEILRLVDQVKAGKVPNVANGE